MVKASTGSKPSRNGLLRAPSSSDARFDAAFAAHLPAAPVRGHPCPHLANAEIEAEERPQCAGAGMEDREMAETKITFQSGAFKLAGTVRVPDGVKSGEKRPAFIVMHARAGA